MRISDVILFVARSDCSDAVLSTQMLQVLNAILLVGSDDDVAVMYMHRSEWTKQLCGPIPHVHQTMDAIFTLPPVAAVLIQRQFYDDDGVFSMSDDDSYGEDAMECEDQEDVCQDHEDVCQDQGDVCQDQGDVCQDQGDVCQDQEDVCQDQDQSVTQDQSDSQDVCQDAQGDCVSECDRMLEHDVGTMVDAMVDEASDTRCIAISSLVFNFAFTLMSIVVVCIATNRFVRA
jgi:hypothetical protein